MLVEFHYLKNYASTNLNRDDLGAPKTCVFGGVSRSRISSQCLKRSWRKSEVFAEIVGEDQIGTRTRKLPLIVKEKIMEHGISEEYANALVPIISGIGNKNGKANKKDETKTAQIVMYGQKDIEKIVSIVEEKVKSCKSVKEVAKISAKEIDEEMKDASIRPVTIDIALFGRMVTSDAFRDVEGAMQVAHAFSTNKVVMESDYFTAMDDLILGESQEDSGAAIVDSTDYNSACYYIYASVDTDILKRNLLEIEDVETLVSKAVEGIMNAMAFSDPSGKQHAFSSHVLPAFSMVICKEKKIPVSYANAFITPIYAKEGKDLVSRSIEELIQENENVMREFQLPVKGIYAFGSSRYMKNLSFPETIAKCDTYQDLVEKVKASLQ